MKPSSHKFAFFLFIVELACLCSGANAAKGFIYPDSDNTLPLGQTNLTINVGDAVRAEWPVDPLTPLIRLGLSCFEFIENATDHQDCGDSVCTLDSDQPMGPCMFPTKQISHVHEASY